MMDQQVLVTGDYWQPDFAGMLAGFGTVTLVPMEKLEEQSLDQFKLIVIAQSRPEQFSSAQLESIHFRCGKTPLVLVAGSWCEGEHRTGFPYPGVLRVYWHQWQGRFEQFQRQLEEEGTTEWHLPRTSTVADRLLARQGGPTQEIDPEQTGRVGISSWSRQQFDSIRDAVQSFGWNSVWVERMVWDADSIESVSVLVIDADSCSSALKHRLQWLANGFPQVGMVVLLNFPRADDVEELSSLGISQVLSKPYELNDLNTAIQKAAPHAPANH